MRPLHNLSIIQKEADSAAEGYLPMPSSLPHNLITQVKPILLPYVRDQDEREALLIEAFFMRDPRPLDLLKQAGSGDVFTVRCIADLVKFGCLAVDGERLHALAALLLTIRERCGVEKHQEIDHWTALLNSQCDNLAPAAAPSSVTRPAPAAPLQTIATPASERTPTVFISYSHTDKPFAERLIADLQAAGHACWIDTVKIKGGEEWIKSITDGINNSYAFVSLLSPDANDSTWVRREFLWAEYRKKPIFSVWVRDCEIPIYVIERQVINAHLNYDAGLRALLLVLPAPSIVSEAAEEQTKEAFAAPEPVEEILRGAEPEPTATPKKHRRALELEYLDRLRFEEFNAEQYTNLSGESQIAGKPAEPGFKPLVMRQEFELTHWAREAQPETRRFEDAVSEILAIRRAVVLGEPGAGKTTTLWKLAKDLFEKALTDPQAPLPILVRLGKWTDETHPLHEFIAAELGELGTHLDALLNEKRAALLLDGLNELPTALRGDKYPQVERFIRQHRELLAVVTCREQDYTVDLHFDRIVIRPLDPLHIREFATRYLGEQDGEALFWKLAGEHARQLENKFRKAFEARLPNWERIFWLSNSLPVGTTWGWQGDNADWEHWLQLREQPSSLMQLARNPYMLSMLAQVYTIREGSLPDNRGELFSGFVETLLLREHVIERDKTTRAVRMTDMARRLLDGLAQLAYEMQIRRSEDKDRGAFTVLPLAEVKARLDERLLYMAGSTSLLSIGDEVRFSHQLLQEYFAARYMQLEIEAGRLQAAALWPPERWWERNNWEDAAVLLAGLYSDDCTYVLDWLADANPEVAAQCILRSGAITPDRTKTRVRDQWLPRLIDVQRDPNPKARAAVGRALGMFLIGRMPADNRIGVSIREDRLPDIDWVEIPAGDFIYGDDKPDDLKFVTPATKQIIRLSRYYISRHLITHAQFQAFIDAPDGFQNPKWWEGLMDAEQYKAQPPKPVFNFLNHPRDAVNWYDAVAFTRWLSDKLEKTITLPTEQQYERAARWTDGRLYPWGTDYISGYANIDETDRIRSGRKLGEYYLGKTSAVGIYPQGVSVEGIYDLSGNVWEWCLNEESSTTELRESNKTRVLRGGSWSGYVDAEPKAAYRLKQSPASRFGSFGFRVVWSSPLPSMH
jgi:formylglycine-generating enzyme required for sulfatase activity